ncbi:MAG TPA: hypothetical protein VKV02_06500 [Acidobacteriaceae bacterium]|nr:hypothetical protein [Acidobacteriaceae bacterium]
MQQSQAAARDHSVAYAVTREYRFSTPGSGRPSSEVVVQVNFVPPAAKDYSIVKTEGSDRGTSLVRKVLTHEVRMTSHPEQHEISRRNYDFGPLGRETLAGRDCYVLKLYPKREAVELIAGKAWVDAKDFSLRRIEGVTAKSPSFWVKELNVTVNFGHLNGVWLQTSTQAVAQIRFVGARLLTSRDLDVRPASLTARARPLMPTRPQANGRRAAKTAAGWAARSSN